MQKHQEDLTNMFYTTHEVLTTNADIYAANAPLVAATGELTDNIEAIQDLHAQQEEDTRGVTEDKLKRRQDLEAETYTIGSIISFYASTTGNRTLMQKVNFRRSDLDRARDNELPGMAEQVIQAATDNAAAILPYGVTSVMTDSLKTVFDKFVEYISKPRAAISETSAATEQLPPLIEATMLLLEERIDRGLELYRDSHPDFFAQYFNARQVVDSPTLKRALEATFINSISRLPVAHIKVKIDDAIERRSSALGNIRVQSLTEGDHTLYTSIPGYADVSYPFTIVSGETTKLTVELVAE